MIFKISFFVKFEQLLLKIYINFTQSLIAYKQNQKHKRESARDYSQCNRAEALG